MTPSLEIESENVSLGEVWVHRQVDPHPGGHTFVLKVPYEYLGQWKEKLTASTSDDLAITALKMMKWEISNWARPKSEFETARFVLNCVTEVQFEKSEVVISGVCSPHLHAEDSRLGE